jgi:hypothetical protein
MRNLMSWQSDFWYFYGAVCPDVSSVYNTIKATQIPFIDQRKFPRSLAGPALGKRVIGSLP